MDKYLNLSRAEKHALLDAQRASGQTVRAFCAERGLKESSFYTWRNRRRKAAAQRSCPTGFVAISPSQSASLPLRLPGGLTLQFSPEQFDLAARLLLEMDRRHAQL